MRVLEKSSLNAILKQTGNTMTRTWTMPSLPIIVEHPAEAKKWVKTAGEAWKNVTTGAWKRKSFYIYIRSYLHENHLSSSIL
jgi:hypothetical protein